VETRNEFEWRTTEIFKVITVFGITLRNSLSLRKIKTTVGNLFQLPHKLKTTVGKNQRPR